MKLLHSGMLRVTHLVSDPAGRQPSQWLRDMLIRAGGPSWEIAREVWPGTSTIYLVLLTISHHIHHRIKEKVVMQERDAFCSSFENRCFIFLIKATIQWETLFIPSVSLKRVRMVKYEIGARHHMFNISQGDFNCPTFGKTIKTSEAVLTDQSVHQDYLHTRDNSVINWSLTESNNVTPSQSL